MTNQTLVICTECGTGRFQSIYPSMFGCTWCGQMIHASDLTPEHDERIVITHDGLLAVEYDL